MMEMLAMLEQDINITTSRTLPVDGMYGGKTKNGSFNGAVGMLMRNETDIFVGPLTLTRERKSVIDYSTTIFQSTLTLWIPLGNKVTLNYTAFVDVFLPDVWMLIGLTLLLFSLGFYIISASGVNKFHAATESEEFGLLSSGALSFLLAIQTSNGMAVQSNSARIIYLVAALVLYCLFSHYECDLTARMTVTSSEDKISNFQDVLDLNYKVIVVESTSMHEILKNAEEGSAMHKVYYDTMHDNPKQLTKDAKDTRSKLFKGEKTLVFSEEISFLLGELNRVKMLRIDEQISRQAGWGIQADSEYLELLNYWLQKLEETGVRERMWNNWTYQASEEFWFEEPAQLGFGNLIFVFLWILGGICMSCLVFIFEKVVNKAKANYVGGTKHRLARPAFE